LTIFPEGNIFRDPQIHPLKEGLARIALQVQADRPELNIKILPVSVHYSQPFPSWRTKIYINIGSPINVADYDTTKIKSSSKTITAHLEAILRELYETKAIDNS
jgi:1-acyl-sn-glycerol-3-phosphate acyltransferase